MRLEEIVIPLQRVPGENQFGFRAFTVKLPPFSRREWNHFRGRA
jgi:hypothetical protein